MNDPIQTNSKTIDNIILAILCGGESSRMGKDKGLLTFSGLTFIEHIIRKIKPLGLNYCLSINPNQVAVYEKEFKEQTLIVDQFSAIGPLGGLLSVHIQYPNKHIMLLPCDDPKVSVKIIDLLIRAIDEYMDAIVLETKKGLEPLRAIYFNKFLKSILIKKKSEATHSKFRSYSLRELLQNAQIQRLAYSESLININTKADFNELGISN